MMGYGSSYGMWNDGQFSWVLMLLFALLALWSLAWKVVGLWQAARDGSKGWFVVLFLLNTLGILEILYLYVFREKEKKFNWRKPFN